MTRSEGRKVVWPNSDGPTVRLMTVIEVAFLRGSGKDDTDPMGGLARQLRPFRKRLLVA